MLLPQERAQCRIRTAGIAPPRLRFLHAGIVDAAESACSGALSLVGDLSETVRRDGLSPQTEHIAMPSKLYTTESVAEQVATDSSAAAPATDSRFDLIR